MKPGTFRYHRPATLDDALALLAEHGDAAKAIAGGQSLVPMMNLRLAQPAELVDLGDLAGLQSIREIDGAIEIGALTRHQAVADNEAVRARCPLLAEAASGIGHYAIRQRGTLGGSLAHADPAAQLPLIAVTLGAEIELASRRGRRRMPASDFFVSIMTTALEPDELIVAVRFPVAAAHEGQALRLFNRRVGDYPIVSVAASLQLRAGRVERLRLGIGAVEPVPVLLADLCARQPGRSADAAWIAELAAAARAAIQPEDAAHLPALYRRELIDTLVMRALTATAQRAARRAGERP
jgi:aerobic carbon-monoxide dehydrogenase medium subunit